MTSKFMKRGSQFYVAKEEDLDLHDQLPAGTYVLKEDRFENLFVERVENFELPGRLYGKTEYHSERVISTFIDRPGGTGVMFAGEKGSGKTMTAKNISIKLKNQGIPTIVINTPFCGDGFNSFIQSITQPCAILFDEFEKVYDRDDQEKILTLLDGSFPTKKLFMFTVNDSMRVDRHMCNRPGRIYYMIEYGGIEAEFIREYCRDNLISHAKYTEKVCELAGLFYTFNFDLLKALVEEMNRYGDSPNDAIQLLNAKPDVDDYGRYAMELLKSGKKIITTSNTWERNPLSRPIEIGYWESSNGGDDDDDRHHHLTFNMGNLSKVDANSGSFIFMKDDYVLTLTRQKLEKFNYNAI